MNCDCTDSCFLLIVLIVSCADCADFADCFVLIMLIVLIAPCAGYAADDFDWGRDQGFRVVQAEECWHKSLNPLMKEVREQLGGGPVYISFDIDGVDPAFAPGTGTAEVLFLYPTPFLGLLFGFFFVLIILSLSGWGAHFDASFGTRERMCWIGYCGG